MTLFERSKNLHSGTPEDRIAGAQDLAKVGNDEREEAIRILVRALRHESHAGVRKAMYSALDELGDTAYLIAGRYRFIRDLGAGSFGRVFLAYDSSLQREVAVKELSEPSLSDGSALDSLEAEASAIAKLNHPNVVTIYDLVGHRFIIMEYLEGGSVADRIRRVGQLMLADAVEIARGVLAALSAVHKLGIVHRDVKPANILFRGADEAKLCDFGIAQLPYTTENGLEGTSEFLGTLAYMSPEQVRGERIDVRSDLYSTGALLFEMLTGEHYLSFGREPPTSLRDFLHRIQREDPPRIGRAFGLIPRSIDRVISSLMQKDPDQRPASAEEALGIVRPLSGRWIRVTRPWRRRPGFYPT